MGQKLVLSFVSLFFINLSSATNATGHAPIGVMGDHYHKTNERMISIVYSAMQMKNNNKLIIGYQMSF